MTTSSVERYYEFQPPTNMNAIRTSIMQRIKQRNEKSNASSIASSSPSSPLTPPPTSNKEEFSKKSPFLLHLDNGLPSPPIETCLYEEEEQLPTEVVVNALLELNEEMESKPTVTLATSEELRERIKLLKEEKHRLFQVMKDLLSKPAAVTTPTPTTATAPEVVPMETTPTTPTKVKERARSTSREIKTRPVIRSRSISHNEYKSPSSSTRPISRYSNTPSRFYSNTSSGNSSYYPYNSNNRSSYPSSPTSTTSSSTLLNMSRRVFNNNNNNNNNNSSYVSSRPQQLAVRPSSSFRLPSSVRPDRY